MQYQGSALSKSWSPKGGYEEAAGEHVRPRICSGLAKRTCMMEKHSTGEATLLIHMLSIIATNMLVTKTVLGLVPALLRTKVAIILAM